MVACTAKWGSSKIHSVVGTGDLLVLAGSRAEKRGRENKERETGFGLIDEHSHVQAEGT